METGRFWLLAVQVFGFLAAADGGLEVRAAIPLEVVSRPYTNLPHAFGDSGGPLLSADGKWAAFGSFGNGLATNDHNGVNLDVFLTSLETGEMRLVTRNGSGGSASGVSSLTGIDGQGRWLVFESEANDLVANDTNGAADVFLYSRESGEVSLLSRSGSGLGNAESGAAQITRNGEYILFESNADNLAAGDHNDGTDLLLLTRATGELRLVTENVEKNGTAQGPAGGVAMGLFEGSVSEDGRYVVFLSAATNLVEGPAAPLNSWAQVYLRDMATGTNYWLSRNGERVGTNSSSPVISADGSVAAFTSARLISPPPTPTSTVEWLHYYMAGSKVLAEVPVPPGIDYNGEGIFEFSMSTNGVLAYALGGQVYRFDPRTGVTTLISAAADGEAGDDTSDEPEISDDGMVIVFSSAATNLDERADGETFQLYRYDMNTGALALLTRDAAGTGAANADILFAASDGAGQKTAFVSFASNLATNDDKFVNDVFVAEGAGTNAVRLISTPLPDYVSSTANGPSNVPRDAVSDDGRFVVFTSSAADIAPGDENDSVDIFLRDLQSGVTRLISTPDGEHPFPGSSGFLGMSRDASAIAFTAEAASGTNGTTIYVHDRALGTNRLASILPNGTAVSAAQGVLSEDGSILAFSEVSGANPGVYVRDLRAQQTFFVTNVLGQPFTLSPSGNYVVVYLRNNTASFIDWRTKAAKTVPYVGGYQDSQMAAEGDRALVYQNAVVTGRSPAPDLYLYSFREGTTNLIATNVSSAAISGDGSTIIAVEQRDGVSDVVMHDVAAGSATALHVQNAGPLLRLQETPVLSRNGRYAALVTKTAITGGVSNGFNNLFIYDRVAGSLTPMNENVSAGELTFGTGGPSFSADGSVLVFESGARTLVENDLNRWSDVFLARLPLAAALRLAAARDAAGRLRISAPAEAGKTYQLQFRSDLGSGAWQDVGTGQSAAGALVEFEVEIAGAEAGFYRVREN